MTLVREQYADFGPTLATEKLAERDGLRVSCETVRGWMADTGLWLSRKQRRTFHHPRLRRGAHGEPVQIDGSEHRWGQLQFSRGFGVDSSTFLEPRVGASPGLAGDAIKLILAVRGRQSIRCSVLPRSPRRESSSAISSV